MTTTRFACEIAERRIVEVGGGGVRLSMLEWPAPGRPPLCFLHGGSAHAHWFDLIAGAFVGRYHIISVDQRGHGESSWPDPPSYATEDFVGDLLGVFDALGWRDVSLVGHSMGGHNALALAAWHPERVRALVIVDSRPVIPTERLDAMHRRGRRGVKTFPSLEAAVEAFRLLPVDTLASRDVMRHIAEAGVERRNGFFCYRFDPNTSALRRPVDNWSLIGRITAPTLVVRGGRSPILLPDMATRLADGIASARLAEIPDAFHHLVFDRPHDFVDALDRFLKDVER